VDYFVVVVVVVVVVVEFDSILNKLFVVLFAFVFFYESKSKQ
jgi:phage-related holin